MALIAKKTKTNSSIGFIKRRSSCTPDKQRKMLRQLTRRRASYRQLNLQSIDKERDKVEAVPKGYVPVMVGREKANSARFLVHIDMFKNEYFVGLLEMVAQEVGYENPGILRVPCDAECFRNLLNQISRIN
ncbi:hypothetical protein PTKIN_Ptkin13bG0090100 [Pterospermum kingtungense]